MPSSLAGIARFPRVRLGHAPTPIDSAPNLGAALGIDLRIKRDDCTGLAFGGNKVRQLEFHFGEARRGQPRLRHPARHARRRAPVGRARRARARRLRQHREEPPKARRALPRPRGAATPRRGARPPCRRTPLAGGRPAPAHAHRGAALRSPQPQVGRARGAGARRRERAPRRLQDRAAHRVARAGSGPAARGAAPGGGRGPRVPRGPHVGSALHPCGAPSARKRGCPACASTTPATPGPPRAS